MAALSFDDLVPQQNAVQSGAMSFDDLIPKTASSFGSNRGVAPSDSSGMTLLPHSAPGQQDNSIAGGLYRGMAGAGIGAIQTVNDLTGQRMLSPEAKAASEKAAANLEAEGKGTGLSGTIEETAGSPLNWAPWKNLLAYGATAGATAPQTNDTGLKGRAVQGAIGAPVAALTGWGAGKLGQAAQWGLNKTGIPDLINTALQKFGASGDGSDMYNLAKEAGLNIQGKSPQEIANSLQEWYQGQTQDLAGKVSQQPYNPEQTFKGIASNWTGEQQAANQAYKGASDIVKNVNQQIPQLPDKIDAVISSLEGNTLPGTSEHTALQQLKNIRATLPDNVPAQQAGSKASSILDASSNPVQIPTAATPAVPAAVPASTLMDLRSNLNESYNPKLLPERGDLLGNSVQSDVRGALAKAGEANPQFGAALQEADARQANLGYSYKNNDLLKKFFKPEDLTALQQNATNGSPIPDITLKRANALLPSIKTPEDMATLTKAMPPELADSLRAAKLQDLMKNAGLNYDNLVNPQFVNLMKESLKDDPEALKQVGTIQQIANALKKRDINVDSPESMRAENQNSGHLLRAAWDLFEGRKAYAIRMTYRALTEEDKAGLSGLASEIQKGAPFKNVIPGIAKQGAARLVGQTIATPSGQPPATGGIGDQNMQELQKLKGANSPQLNPSNSTPLKPQANASDFFTKMAKAENNTGNPAAKNPNSSASGAFQFIDSTWKQMVKRYGAETGIRLEDKNDPKAQQVMAQLYAKDNINQMQPFLKRMPTKGELYQAHVLGADGALRLINAANTTPEKQALLLYPRKTTADNAPYFFENAGTAKHFIPGKPLTVLQTYQLMSKKVI